MPTRTASSVQVTGLKMFMSLGVLPPCLAPSTVPLSIAAPVSPQASCLSSDVPVSPSSESLCLPPESSGPACRCAWEPPVSTSASCRGGRSLSMLACCRGPAYQAGTQCRRGGAHQAGGTAEDNRLQGAYRPRHAAHAATVRRCTQAHVDVKATSCPVSHAQRCWSPLSHNIWPCSCCAI